MMKQPRAAHFRVRTGRAVQLRVALGVVRLETDLEPDDGTFEYTLRADDGSFEESMSASGDDASSGPVFMTFESVPMDRTYSLEVTPPDGEAPYFAFESVPFGALQL